MIDTHHQQARIQIGPVLIDPVAMDDAVEQIIDWARTEQPKMRRVVPTNAQLVEIASGNVEYAEMMRSSDLVLADGMSIVCMARAMWHARLQRVAGVDLMVRICERAAQEKLSVYYLGGKPGTAQTTADRLTKEYPGLRIAGVDCPPMGFEKNANRAQLTADHVRAAAPDLLFVGFGAPKQELWMWRNAGLPVRVAMGVGCSFDVLSGEVERAPSWMQRCGMEWVFRLSREPKRLFRRVVSGYYRMFVIAFRHCLLGPSQQHALPVTTDAEILRKNHVQQKDGAV
jgi:N-acetylglucosaminyldiphosphoundecaprenol N-acetyl-beta-D-mannosaminyltransferase